MYDRDVLETDLVFTVAWEAKPAELDALTEIARRFAPLAEGEPGLKMLRIHQSMAEPTKFFFYEVFESEAAYEAHLETDHFKKMILGEAVPKLAHRERVRHKVMSSRRDKAAALRSAL